MSLGGLSKIFIEWTSRCDKTHLCSMCGHQSQEINPNLRFGNMSLGLMEELRGQLPRGIEVAFHKDGDPLAHSHVREAIDIFSGLVSTVVTHGLNLGRKADQIIGRCSTVVVSVFRGDPDRDAQLQSIKEFCEAKGNRLPRLIVKIVGDMSESESSVYWQYADQVIHRLIHVPIGNSKYAHRFPTIPESGICQDLLHVPSVAWDGRVFLCNRLDVHDAGFIGDATAQSLDEIWNGPIRQGYLQKHLIGQRTEVPPCATCEYYGVPTA